jgi:hypothetical protein
VPLTNFRSVSGKLALALVLSFGLVSESQAQSGCAQRGTAATALPRYTGTLPNVLSTGGNSNYLYVLTQWGFARGSLADPANPTGFTLLNVGKEAGSGNGGLIPVNCDCHQGSTMMAAAEAADGSARMILDFAPSTRGFGLAGELARADGGGGIKFGNQINLPDVLQNRKLAAIYSASSQKYFGYFPTVLAGIQIVDLTNTTGTTTVDQALQSTNGPSWSGVYGLTAARVQASAYDELLLLGATPGSSSSTIRVARINPSSGSASELATVSASGYPISLAFGVVNGRIFIFSAEGAQGLRIYEFSPSQFGGTITPAGSIPGNFDLLVVKGNQFPVIFAHRKVSSIQSFIDVYDTKFLVQGGTFQLAYSLPHFSSTASFRPGLEAVVKSNAGLLTAYVYRQANAAAVGEEARIITDVLDLTCISADQTAPPLASATLANLSAAQRSGTEATKNYFGDRWRAQNSSASAVALDQIQWDLNVLNVGGASAFQADAAFSGALPNATLTDLNPIYFPCDPSGAVAGDPRTGATCYGSVNSPAGPADFRAGLLSHNTNGWSTAPFISSAVTIQAPTARIAGFSGGVLRVLSGGQADASGSDGNVADAAFNWAFFDSVGGGVGTAQGSRVSIPLASRTFRLTAVYRGGYTAPVLNGSIQQVDLVPDFTATPNPVVKSGTLTLNNTMQISPSATLTSVTYAINSTPALSGTLGSGFSGPQKQDTVTVPGTPGSYTIQLTYTFTGPSAPGTQSLSVTKPFNVIDQIILTLVANPTTANTGQTVTFTATGGTPTSTYGWNFGDNPFSGFTAGGATNSHSYSSPSSFTATTCVTNAGSPQPCANATVTINGSAPPPPPPPPPPSSVTASLSCPAQGATGTPVTCNASASGGSGSYSYAWNWGDNVFGSGFTQGTASNSHTYSSAAVYVITAKMTSGSAFATATASVNVILSGPPRPSAGFTVTGATANQFSGNYEVEAGAPVTLAATEPDTAATFAWEVTGGLTNPTSPFTQRTAQFAFTSPGTRTVNLTVTGGGAATSGVTSTQIRFAVTAPRFQALMIPGAGHIDPVPPATDGTWATDISITNPGTQPMTLTLDYEPFGTTFPADLSLIEFNSVNSVPLAAGQSWSATDVVKTRLAKDGRGVLIIKYDGGNADPIATATVYYTQEGRAFGSSLPTFRVGPYGTTTTQSLEAVTEQTLVGLRNDGSYRFNVSLFNASGQSGFFQLSAFGDDGVQVPMLDETGASVMTRQFPIGAFQQALLQSGELGLNDPAKRYVLKASPVSSTGGGLLAAASALDRRNNDLVLVSDDTPRIAAAADALIDYFIPGVGRIGRDDVPEGAHWKTDLTLYSNSSLPRDLTFEYRYTDRLGVEQRVLAPVTVSPGKSVILDDVVGSILARYAPAGIDLMQESTLGLLRISYRAASDSSTAPLLIGGRIYDDRGNAGTAGMQLFVYSNGESVAVGSPLVLPGAQQNLRFRTNIGFFAMGDLPTRVRVTAVKPDGVAAGTFDFVLNDSGHWGHFVQMSMAQIPGIVGDPMTIKVEVLEGSRVGAYVVTVDQISSDSIFVQGRPTRLAN